MCCYSNNSLEFWLIIREALSCLSRHETWLLRSIQGLLWEANQEQRFCATDAAPLSHVSSPRENLGSEGVCSWFFVDYYLLFLVTLTHRWRLFVAITWPPRFKRWRRRNPRLLPTRPPWRTCKLSSFQSKSSWMKQGSTAKQLPEKSKVSNTTQRSALLSWILRNGD